MRKNTYYFSHDLNARSDPKIMAMLQEYGIAGYGAWWVVIETLAEQSEYELPKKGWVWSALARAIGWQTQEVADFIERLINEFELLQEDEEHFYSCSLKKRMSYLDDKRKKRSEAGKKGAEKRWEKRGNGNAIANAKQSHSNVMAKDGKGTERKGTRKELKGKERTGKEQQQKPAHEKIPHKDIIEHLNSATGRNYRHSTKKNQDLIRARWNEGFRFDDFRQVIDKKTLEWKDDPGMAKFLRPETLFGTKFEGYLNQPWPEKKRSKMDILEDRFRQVSGSEQNDPF